MTRIMTATEAKAKFLSLLDDVAGGEEIEITKHGRTVARLAPARGPHALLGMFVGLVWTASEDDDLLDSRMDWEILRDDGPA